MDKLAEWATKTPHNLLDEVAVARPETTVLLAHNDKPITFLPVQIVAALESLATNPDATDLEKAKALEQLVKTIAFLARKQGIHEIYFYTKDDDVAKLAIRHGFEDMPHRTLRLNLDKLEGNDE